MQRTFITERPDTLEAHQVEVDLPRYELCLARALQRRDIQKATRFINDDEVLTLPPLTLNQVKTFVDELAILDRDIDDGARIPYTNYVGLGFPTAKDAVFWARNFVRRHFPATEERLLKRVLLTLPLDKTEIVWVGPERYLPFIQAVATSPSSDDLVAANAPSQPAAPQLTIEEAKAKRAAIAAKKNKTAAKEGKIESEENGENQEPQA